MADIDEETDVLCLAAAAVIILVCSFDNRTAIFYDAMGVLPEEEADWLEDQAHPFEIQHAIFRTDDVASSSNLTGCGYTGTVCY